MEIIFLGTGANGGTPQIDCRCKFCVSKDTKDKRLRSSFLVKLPNKNILIECGPDVRQQLFRERLKIDEIDLITISHLHHDHVGGLTELTAGKPHQKSVAVPTSIQSILKSEASAFIFKNGFASFTKSPLLKFFKVPHWPNKPCYGIQIGENKEVWYSGDISQITGNMLLTAKEAKLLICDGTFLSESKHNHLSIKQTCKILKTLNKNIIFTHVNHSENPKEIEKTIKPFGFKLAFDGMRVKV